MDVAKPRCTYCQQTKCSLKNCLIMKLTTSTTPQQEECRAKDNMASILSNLKAMPVEDRLGMITTLFEEELVKPDYDVPNSMNGCEKSMTLARIRAHQVGSNKLMTKEQVQKCLWQHSAEE